LKVVNNLLHPYTEQKQNMIYRMKSFSFTLALTLITSSQNVPRLSG